MKKIIIFVAVGLLVGLAGGSFLRGTKERDVILAQMAAEKAVADSLKALEEGDSPHGEGTGTVDGLASGDAEVGGEGEEPHGAERTLAEETDGSQEEAVGDLASGSPEEKNPETGEGLPSQPTSASALAAPGGGTRTTSDQSGSTEGPARMAKIFGAMEAKDAAAVLSNLSDAEVQSILQNMSERKVAEILGEFAPERAASLSRVVLAARAGIGG